MDIAHSIEAWQREPTSGIRRQLLGCVAGLMAIGPAAGGSCGPTPESYHAGARLVTAGGDLTEIVVALGAGEQLVGVDSTSTWPASVSNLPQVGYMRSLATEGIVLLRPSLVLVSEHAGPPAVLAQIRALGIAVEVIRGSSTEAGAVAKIEAVGGVLNRRCEAQRLTAGLQHDLQEARALVQAPGPKLRAVFLMGSNPGHQTAAGTGTAADAIITLAGGTNAFASMPGYRPVTSEALLAAAPDIILVPKHVLSLVSGTSGLRSRLGLSSKAEGKDCRIVEVDAAFLLGFGPRLAAAVRWLYAVLYGRNH